MPSAIAFKTTKFMLDIATKLIKADVRLHNAGVIKPDMSIIFVVNHFTRLETILLPHKIYKETGLEPWSLASGNLFFGRLGWFLHSVGTVSTTDPDRDKIIASSLLRGANPWIIFPEGGMIKDKKLVDLKGVFQVYDKGERRSPHTGAAVLALRTEYYRQKLFCIHENPRLKDQGPAVLERFGLDSYEDAAKFRTVIIPTNITYFPMRSRANIVMRLARGLAKNLSERALEELSVEGTILAEESDVDIRLGEPIDVRTYLEGPAFAEMMACSDDDINKLEEDPRSVFNEVAASVMQRYMADIYRMTTINSDHLLSTIIRHQKAREMTESEYRSRLYLSARKVVRAGANPVHGILKNYYPTFLDDEPCPKVEDFLKICMQEGVLRRTNGAYEKNFDVPEGRADFHSIRRRELTTVIANEIEPLPAIVDLARDYGRAADKEIGREIRDILLEEDQRIFEEDYEQFLDPNSVKAREIGRPFLLTPKRAKAGIVLAHGYLAAPLEVRAMAEYFAAQGYIVYGVRLKGHGTSPEDLARTTWEEWRNSFNRGYAVVKTLVPDVILGGFSTGGTLALLGAARKRGRIRAVFAVNAPQELRRYAAHLVPSVLAASSFFERMTRRKMEERFVENNPENAHINYARNPMAAVRELNEAMDAMERELPNVCAPALIVQGSRDPIVDPASGRFIFAQLGTPDKELVMLERDRHGIINGEGADDIFERIDHFLTWALRRQSACEPKADD